MMVWWDLSWISAKISEVRENISKYIADCNYKTWGASSESAKAGSKHRLIRCIGGLILKLTRPRRKWLIWSRCNPQCCDQISLAHERRPSDWNSSRHENLYSELGGSVFTAKIGKLTLEMNESGDSTHTWYFGQLPKQTWELPGSVLYIFCGGQNRKLYIVKLRSMNPARVQEKHDIDQWSKQRSRRKRKYILIGQATQGVSSTCKGEKKIFCIFWDKHLTGKLFTGQKTLFNILWEKPHVQ